MSENRTIRKTNRGRSLVAALLVFVTLALTLLATTGCSKKFDYLSDNLDEYIEFSQDYKNLKLEVDIAKPHDIDVDVAILNMIYGDRSDTPKYNGTVTSPITITAGDVVYIWYRGYILDDEGGEIAVSGMSNFSGSAASSLAIGSNNFVPGFELNMIGKNTGDYSRFNKITSGEVKNNYILYVSYSRVKGTDSATKVTESNLRIDLSTDIDATYGAGFKEKLLGMQVGGDKVDFKTTIGDAEYTYTDLKIVFATDCESNPMVIECYFPYDYSNKPELRNETAYFEVYVEGVDVYECPEFNDEYLKKKIEDKEINVTLEDLKDCKGETLVDKYRDFAWKTLNELYEENYKTAVEEAMWSKINSISKVKKYPTDKVDEVYDDYVKDIEAQFIADGGKIYNNYTGQATTYDTFDAYATAYLGLTSTSSISWQQSVYAQAESVIKERLALFYIIRKENLVPTEAELQAAFDEIEQEFIDEAIAQYLYYAGKTEDDLTEEERNEMVQDCHDMVYNNFDTSFFEIRAYYRIISKVMLDWPEVSTFDDRRAYPLDK